MVLSWAGFQVCLAGRDWSAGAGRQPSLPEFGLAVNAGREDSLE